MVNDTDMTDIIEGITQRGEAVPSGYVFNPRKNPPLYKRDDTPERSQIATDSTVKVVADPAHQPLVSSDDASERSGVGDGHQ